MTETGLRLRVGGSPEISTINFCAKITANLKISMWHSGSEHDKKVDKATHTTVCKGTARPHPRVLDLFVQKKLCLVAWDTLFSIYLREKTIRPGASLYLIREFLCWVVIPLH